MNMEASGSMIDHHHIRTVSNTTGKLSVAELARHQVRSAGDQNAGRVGLGRPVAKQNCQLRGGVTAKVVILTTN